MEFQKPPQTAPPQTASPHLPPENSPPSPIPEQNEAAPLDAETAVDVENPGAENVSAAESVLGRSAQNEESAVVGATAQSVAPVRSSFSGGAGEEDNSRTDYAEFERLFRLWKENGDPALRERLIFMHRNLVTYLARRFVERGDLYEDVVQVGLLGLIYAIDAFDINRGLKFSTFAIPTISGEMRRFFRDKVSGMKVPRRLQELYLAIHPHVEEMTQRYGRAPTYAEIAFEMKIEVEEVVEALELGSALEPASLDDFQFNDAEGDSIADSIGALDPNLSVYEEHTALQAALERLTEKERRVLEMAYFEGHSQAEIARRLNVSQMHISRLLRKSLGQLRQLLEEV